MAIKFLHDLDVQGNIDFNDNQALNMVLQQLSTNPGTVVEGMIFKNTTSDKVYVGLNGSWVELSSAIGDITEVIGGTNINVSGGTSGAATVNLDSSVEPAQASQSGTWSTADAALATVDANGVVTGVAAGTVVITFTASDATTTATSTVTVS
mgnify:CR=1 FL=1